MREQEQIYSGGRRGVGAQTIKAPSLRSNEAADPVIWGSAVRGNRNHHTSCRRIVAGMGEAGLRQGGIDESSLVARWNQKLLGNVPESFRPPIYLVLGLGWVGLCVGIGIGLAFVFVSKSPAGHPNAPVSGSFWLILLLVMALLLLPVFAAIAFGGTGNRARSGRDRSSGMRYAFVVAGLLLVGGVALLTFGGYFGAVVCTMTALLFGSIGVAWFRTPSNFT